MPDHRLQLILASSSPRRRQLLEQAGYTFRVVAPGEQAECGVCSRETPGELVVRLARQKAADVIQQLLSPPQPMPQGRPTRAPGDPAFQPEPPGPFAGQYSKNTDQSSSAEIVVACDTVAECHGQVLGKPAHLDHARQMLRMLRGQVHRVYSGLCVWQLGRPQPLVDLACTVLRMDALDDEQIDDYLASGLWEGKAGAFGYQDRAGWLHVESGSESNVVGLPMELLAQMLTHAGEY